VLWAEGFLGVGLSSSEHLHWAGRSAIGLGLLTERRKKRVNLNQPKPGRATGPIRAEALYPGNTSGSGENPSLIAQEEGETFRAISRRWQ